MRSFTEESVVAPSGNGTMTFSCGGEHGAADAALLATILDNLTQGIAVFDGDLKLRAFNRRYVELFVLTESFVAH